MMKNLQYVAISLFIILSASSVYSQDQIKTPVDASNTITKSTQVFSPGASLAFGFNKLETDFNFNVGAAYGKFITERFLLEGSVYFHTSQIWYNATTSPIYLYSYDYGCGAAGRYYFDVKNRHAFYIGAGINLINETLGTPGEKPTNILGLDYGAGPGYSYFLTPYLALDAVLAYQRNQYLSHSSTNNSAGSVSLNLGVSWFVTKACR
jgi:hypothetical protein